MKKNIRKVILDNITVVSAIGVVCGIVTLALAALCMNGSDLIGGVVAAAAVTIIGSAVAAAWASKKLNGCSDCSNKKHKNVACHATKTSFVCGIMKPQNKGGFLL